ncbi:ATP-dependent helicase HrpB [Pleionea sp. CnH1-48]|uniref:ATP-dependent helicase HrpB n=1 Tax=Pleionea sp. CnH1-48 TaxID=2954494 RepID=UPI0020969091|nr:ATP-dependent helicase HrpB [Pleionea sp. CnH1-48]MCO7223173.1 ATP-dependent helicase HrpB [Pleionea sp. CnH1-48]
MQNLDAVIAQSQLPVSQVIGDVRQQLAKHQRAILQAEPGAGKTTLIPLALLGDVTSNQKIVMLEPRRLAARNAAMRMAEMLGEQVGETVGYRIRNDVKVGPHTRIEVITEGILTRMIQSDPELTGIALIIFDEFHERSLHADLGLALAYEVQSALRDDLSLLVMSATIDTSSVSALLDEAPVIQCEGRRYPVTTEYLMASRANRDRLEQLLPAVKKALIETQGNVLVFLPGVGDILRAQERINDFDFSQEGLPRPEVSVLYGDLNWQQQQKAVRPLPDQRTIILATNIAETSLTIAGIQAVIDSGWMRQSEFEPQRGFNRLVTRRIAKDSAEQRAGRAGRLSAGKCYRLWPESESLAPYSRAEILRSDMAPMVLELAQWGVFEPTELKLLDMPNAGAYQQAQKLLRQLSALDKENRITRTGQQSLKLGVHPRLANMLFQSINMKLVRSACLLAALLEERDILSGDEGRNPDILMRLLLLQREQNKRNTRYQRIMQQATSLQNKLKQLVGSLPTETEADDKTLGLLLAYAYPDRIAQKRGQGYRLANGSGAAFADDFMIDFDWLVAVDISGNDRHGHIRLTAPLDKSDVIEAFGDQVVRQQEHHWNDKLQQVEVENISRYQALVLEREAVREPEPQLLTQGLLAAISKMGVAALPWTPHLRQWQARIERLRSVAEFESLFPDVSEQQLAVTLNDWLAPFIVGKKAIKQITEQDLQQALFSLLDWPQQQQLDELMPTHWPVPSGSKITLDYMQGEQPILAVKLQEMFGVKESPRVAQNRIAVVVHLLSPARRPLQITQDLANFWSHGYDDVKKEMKGRYPKHPWPDDPLTAVATRKTKHRQ